MTKIKNFIEGYTYEIITISGILIINAILSLIGLSPKGWIGIIGVPVMIFGLIVLEELIADKFFESIDYPEGTSVLVLTLLLAPNYFIVNIILRKLNVHMSILNYILVLVSWAVTVVIYEQIEEKFISKIERKNKRNESKQK